MCTTVVLPTGEWITGVTALGEAGWPVTDDDIDPEDLAVLGELADVGHDLCLCSVDVDAVLERHDVIYTTEVPGFYDVVLIGPPKP